MNIPRHIVEHIVSGFKGVGSNVLTVGTRGQFPTIQAAVDYVSSLNHFVSYSPANAPALVQSWTLGSSNVVTLADDGYGSAGDTWFHVTGDVFRYPMQGPDAILPGFLSAINRIEASIAAPTAISYFREMRHTIMLLDAEFQEGIVIDANVNIDFVSAGVSRWRGATSAAGAIKRTANFNYGSLNFGRGIVAVADGISGTGSFFIGAGGSWTSANCVCVRFSAGAVMQNNGKADFCSPDVFLGEFKSKHCDMLIDTVSPNSHFIHVKCGGDVIITQGAMEISCSPAISFLSPDARVFDKVKGRSVNIAGLDVVVNDPGGRLTDVMLVTGLNEATGKIFLDNIRLTAMHPNATNLYIAHEGASAASVDSSISSCSIVAPGNTGTKKIYHAVTGSTSDITVSMCSGGTIDTPSAGTKTVNNSLSA